MKVIKYLIGLAAISGILLFGLKYYTENHYLKISNKGAHIETYEEVPREKVPEKALAIIG